MEDDQQRYLCCSSRPAERAVVLKSLMNSFLVVKVIDPPTFCDIYILVENNCFKLER